MQEVFHKALCVCIILGTFKKVNILAVEIGHFPQQFVGLAYCCLLALIRHGLRRATFPKGEGFAGDS